MKVLAFFAVLFVLLSSSSISFAQSDSAEFPIRVFIGQDDEAPSTPTLLSVTPIASTQIDITWSVATDNFALGGYVVSRDGVPIATTTLTSYSDTGLIASTTYAYVVQAFDVNFNYSSTSNSLSTTTPDTPVPPTPDPVASTTSGAESTSARVAVRDVTITPGFSTTSVSVTTAFPTRFEIRWGRTASYELGYIATEALRSSYYTMLTDLEPGTRYEYEIIGYTPAGARTTIQRGNFTTLSSFDSIPPPNVLRFIGVTNGANAELSWQLPATEGISFVRVVRSHLGFPLTPIDGAVVYQGTGETAVDVGVLALYSPAYYTAFVYDNAGNVSSGAVATVYAQNVPGVTSEGIVTDDGLVPVGQPEPPRNPLPDSVVMPQSFDIHVTQGQETRTFADGLIQLHAEQPTLISINREAVSPYLKTIIVRLTDPTDQRITHSLLLRLNKDQTAYEAVFAPLNVAGQSNLFVDVYDLENYIVANYRSAVVFTVGEVERGTNRTTLAEVALIVGTSSVALAVFMLLWFVVRRTTEDNGR